MLWGVPATGIVAIALSVEFATTRIQAYLMSIGAASYAIYLTHGFVMNAYALLLRYPAFNALPQMAIVPFVVVAASIFGVAVHLAVERP